MEKQNPYPARAIVPWAGGDSHHSESVGKAPVHHLTDRGGLLLAGLRDSLHDAEEDLFLIV